MAGIVMSEHIAQAYQSPSRTPEPSTNPIASERSSISDTDGMEVLLPPFPYEESKEDSTTVNHDPPHTKRDSDIRNSEKRLLMSQSTQPIEESVDAGGSSERIKKPLISQQGYQRVRYKPPRSPLIPLRSDVGLEVPKAEVPAGGQRPRTADVYSGKVTEGDEDGGRVKEDGGRKTPPGSKNVRLLEVESYPTDKPPSKPSSPILNQHTTSDPDLPEAPESPVMRPTSPPQLRLTTPPVPEPRISTPQQPRLPSPHLEEEKFPPPPASPRAPASPESANSDSQFVPLVHGRLVSEYPSEDESQPRPADSIAMIPSELQLEASPNQIYPEIEDPLAQSYHRKRSIDDPPILPMPQKPILNQDLQPAVVTYKQCLAALRKTDLSGFIPQSVSSQPRNCCQSLLCCFPTPRLSAERRKEYETLLALQKRPIGSLDIDISLMYSLWRLHFPNEVFTLDSEVWTGLGFRNSDPRAEASTLELLELFYISQEKRELTTSLLTYSRTRGTMFNFALEVTAVTKLAVKIAKSGGLTAVFVESSTDVFETFNNFFLGSLLEWFSEHQQTPGRVDWKLLEARLRKHPQTVL